MPRKWSYFRTRRLVARPAANDACWDSGLVLAAYGLATLVAGGIALVLTLG